jgi:FtsZ-binding cell division protein ZapB
MDEVDGQLSLVEKENAQLKSQLVEADGRLEKEITQLKSQMANVNGRLSSQLAEADRRLERENTQLKSQMDKVQELIKGMFCCLFTLKARVTKNPWGY